MGVFINFSSGSNIYYRSHSSGRKTILHRTTVVGSGATGISEQIPPLTPQPPPPTGSFRGPISYNSRVSLRNIAFGASITNCGNTASCGPYVAVSATGGTQLFDWTLVPVSAAGTVRVGDDVFIKSLTVANTFISSCPVTPTELGSFATLQLATSQPAVAFRILSTDGLALIGDNVMSGSTRITFVTTPQRVLRMAINVTGCNTVAVLDPGPIQNTQSTFVIEGSG